MALAVSLKCKNSGVRSVQNKNDEKKNISKKDAKKINGFVNNCRIIRRKNKLKQRKNKFTWRNR